MWYEEHHGEAFKVEIVRGKTRFTSQGKGKGKGGEGKGRWQERESGKAKGKGKKGKDIECYGCGRLGHIARNCQYDTHVKGGKKNVRPQHAALVEEVVQEVDAGLLEGDLFVLEEVSGPKWFQPSLLDPWHDYVTPQDSQQGAGESAKIPQRSQQGAGEPAKIPQRSQQRTEAAKTPQQPEGFTTPVKHTTSSSPGSGQEIMERIKAGHDIRDVIQMPSPDASSSAMDLLMAPPPANKPTPLRREPTRVRWMKAAAAEEVESPREQAKKLKEAAFSYAPPGLPGPPRTSQNLPEHPQKEICCNLCEGKGWVTRGSRMDFSSHALQAFAAAVEKAADLTANHTFAKAMVKKEVKIEERSAQTDEQTTAEASSSKGPVRFQIGSPSPRFGDRIAEGAWETLTEAQWKPISESPVPASEAEDLIEEKLQKIKEAFGNLKAQNAESADLLVMDVDDDASWKKVEITVDSGASKSVMDGDPYPGVKRVPSKGSVAGQMFRGAGMADSMPNRGQKRFKTCNKKGMKSGMTFQDVKVRKPLAAVSDINQKGNMVIFDCRESAILPAGAPELEEIRKLLKKVKDRVALEEKNGTFIMSLWMQTEEAEPEGFTGQGR